LTRLQPAFSAPASSWPPMMDTGGGGGERAAFIVKVYGLLFTMLGITAAVALLITRSLRVPTLRDVLGLFGGAGVLGSLTASIRMPRRQRRLAGGSGRLEYLCPRSWRFLGKQVSFAHMAREELSRARRGSRRKGLLAAFAKRAPPVRAPALDGGVRGRPPGSSTPPRRWTTSRSCSAFARAAVPWPLCTGAASSGGARCGAGTDASCAALLTRSRRKRHHRQPMPGGRSSWGRCARSSWCGPGWRVQRAARDEWVTCTRWSLIARWIRRSSVGCEALLGPLPSVS